MKITRTFLLLAAIVVPVFAVDYAVDPTFNTPFTRFDNVQDVHLLGDGRLLVVGAYCTQSGQCTPFVVRLNSNGSLDPTFSVAITAVTQGGGSVGAIKPLASGKFLLTGDFNVGAQRTHFARINADGALDPTLPPTIVTSGYGFRPIEPLPDSKMLVCADRTINGELYRTAHRLNSDGTPDPTFRVTFMTAGFCQDIQPLQNGKIMVAVRTWDWEPQVKPLHRLNADGTRDSTFDGDLPLNSYVRGLTVLPNGKLLFNSAQQGVNYSPGKRLTANGTLDLEIPLCSGSAFLPLGDGSMFVSGCRRWQYYYGTEIQWAKVYPDGSVDQTIDNIEFDNRSIYGFRNAGNDKYYVFGGFGGVNRDYNRFKLVRLAPNLTPKRAKFDFDGDGRSDIAVYRPSNGVWYLYQSTAGIAYRYWGFSTDKVAAAHFDNDGKTDVAVFRDGTWHGWSSLIDNWRYLQIGAAGDQPMPGDFEDMGPSIEDQAVRGIRSGAPRWFLREGMYVANPTSTAYEYSLPGEQTADKPVVGDFSGDSRDELGYFQNGYWYSADYRGYAPPQTFQWGVAGDIPVPGDYDGDRQDDYAIYRPSTGTWWINQSTAGIVAIKFGISTDIPVPADYDGDGKVDLAIYRDGQWWQFLSGSQNYAVVNWGTSTDKPIPAQAQQ